jgi:type IV secretory pathway TrbL component
LFGSFLIKQLTTAMGTSCVSNDVADVQLAALAFVLLFFCFVLFVFCFFEL